MQMIYFITGKTAKQLLEKKNSMVTDNNGFPIEQINYKPVVPVWNSKNGEIMMSPYASENPRSYSPYVSVRVPDNARQGNNDFLFQYSSIIIHLQELKSHSMVNQMVLQFSFMNDHFLNHLFLEWTPEETWQYKKKKGMRTGFPDRIIINTEMKKIKRNETIAKLLFGDESKVTVEFSRTEFFEDNASGLDFSDNYTFSFPSGTTREDVEKELNNKLIQWTLEKTKPQFKILSTSSRSEGVI